MKLYEIAFYQLMRSSLNKAEILKKNQFEIGKFEELCAVLKAQGNEFTAEIEPDEIEVNYFIIPKNYGDYLAMIEALAVMGAHRESTNNQCDSVNPQPDAPFFFLRIPESHFAVAS